MSNLTCHHEGAKALSSSGSQACMIGIHLVYHLHRAWFAQEGPSGSHMLENFLVVWMNNFDEGQLPPWSYQVIVESV